METDAVKIDGWTTELDGVSWVATRDEPLTEWQRRYGCRKRVEATTPQELRLLCSAEDVHAGFVSAAEVLLATMADQSRKWREQTDQADADAAREVTPPDDKSGPAFMTRWTRTPADPDEVMPAPRDDWRRKR